MRWHPDRIGGAFTANAEAVADRALVQPLLEPADYNLHEGRQVGECVWLARLTLDGQVIAGWVKRYPAAQVGTELYLSALATLWGAPAAPLIMLDKNTAFSPACLAMPDPLDTATAYSSIDPYSLGAAGQFRLLINDYDGEHNMVRCRKTDRFHLIDYGGAEPCLPGTSVSCERFISNCLEMFDERSDKMARYKAGATLMSRRISSTSVDELVKVAKAIAYTHGVEMDMQIINGLAARKHTLQRPQFPRLLDCAAPRFR